MSVEWRTSGTKWTFWNRVLKYARKRCQDTWPFQDRKCPHCKTWASEVGGFSTSRDSMSLEPHDFMKCSQCGKTSKWHNEGIVAWTIKDDGTPTDDCDFVKAVKP